MKQPHLMDLLPGKKRCMLGSAHIEVSQVLASYWVLSCKKEEEQKEGGAGRQGPVKRTWASRDSGIPTTRSPGWWETCSKR